MELTQLTTWSKYPWSVLFSGVWFVSWPAVSFHAVFVAFCSIRSSTVVVGALGCPCSAVYPSVCVVLPCASTVFAFL